MRQLRDVHLAYFILWTDRSCLGQEWIPVATRILQSWLRHPEGEKERPRNLDVLETWHDVLTWISLEEPVLYAVHSFLGVFQDSHVGFCDYPSLSLRASTGHSDMTPQSQFTADDNWLWEVGLKGSCVQQYLISLFFKRNSITVKSESFQAFRYLFCWHIKVFNIERRRWSYKIVSQSS